MERFEEAMDDDFNTALAMAHVFDLVRSVNRVLVEEREGDEPGGHQSGKGMHCGDGESLRRIYFGARLLS